MIKNLLMMGLGLSVFCTQTLMAAPPTTKPLTPTTPAAAPKPNLDGYNAGMRLTEQVIAKYKAKEKVKPKKRYRKSR